jgi:hypothetical protein
MDTKNKIKTGALLITVFMVQGAVSFSQQLSLNINPPYNNHQQVSIFTGNTNQPLEVTAEHDKTTVTWNIPYAYDTGFIIFLDNNDNILTTWELNGKKSGKINIFGSTDKARIFSYKLITDDRIIGSYTEEITPLEEDTLKIMQDLSSK